MKKKCPICNALTQTSLRPLSSNGEWEMYLCHSCGAHFQYPNKQNKHLYDKKYFEGSGADSMVNYSEISLFEHELTGYKISALYSLYQRLHNKEQIKTKPRFLDVGPGNGSVLIGAQNYFDVTAFDITRENEKLMQRNGFKGKFRIIDLESVHPKIQKESFDVIHLSEIVEHLSNPKTFFTNIAFLLKKNGIIFIQTGRADSWTARIEKEKWIYYRLVHSIIYSRLALELLLRKNNLEIVSLKRDIETIPQAAKIFSKTKNMSYLSTYILGKIIKDFGRMQMIAVKK